MLTLHLSHHFKASGGESHCGRLEWPRTEERSGPAGFITPDVLFNASPGKSAPSEGHLSLLFSFHFFCAHLKSCDSLRPQVELLLRGQDLEPSGTFRREPWGLL